MKAFLLFLFVGFFTLLCILSLDESPVVARTSASSPICNHVGVNEILMSLVDNKDIKKKDLLTLKKLGIAIKRGEKKTDLTKGVFRLSKNSFVVNHCDSYADDSVVAVEEEIEEPVKVLEGLCDHDGVNGLLLKVAIGKTLERRELKNLRTYVDVKEGNRKTNLKEGMFAITDSLYVQNYCDLYFEEIKDYLPDGAEVPAHLSR